MQAIDVTHRHHDGFYDVTKNDLLQDGEECYFVGDEFLRFDGEDYKIVSCEDLSGWGECTEVIVYQDFDGEHHLFCRP